MDAATEPAVSAQDAAVEDRRKKLELWKAQREAEKAAAKAGGKRGAAGAAGAAWGAVRGPVGLIGLHHMKQLKRNQQEAAKAEATFEAGCIA